MRVYRPQDDAVARHTVYVQPGREFPILDWLDKDGKPILFAVEFRGGVATVQDNLGQYMIDHEIAQDSPLLLPPNSGLNHAISQPKY